MSLGNSTLGEVSKILGTIWRKEQYVKPLIRVNSCLMVPPCCLALSLALEEGVS